MLTKKDLRRIKVPVLYKNQYGNLVWSNSNTFIVRSRIERKGNVLVVALYSVKYPEEKPVYTIYLTKNDSVILDRSGFYDIKTKTNYHKKSDTITPKEKWLTGALERYVNTYSSVNYGSDQDYIRICSYLGESVSSRNALVKISSFQQDQKNRILYEKKSARLLQINSFMKCVPSGLPKGLERWVDNVPLLKSRYIIYRRHTTKRASGYCTHCKKEVDLSHLIPKHMQTGSCPECGSHIQFLARGRLKHRWFDDAFCAVARRTKDNQGIVFSFFEIFKCYNKNNLENPETNISECYRISTDLTGKITGYYRKSSNSHTGSFSWHPTDFHTQSGNRRYYYYTGMYKWELYSCYMDQCIYPHNLKSVIRETGYEHLPSLLKYTKQPSDITTALENAQASPVREIIEKLSKVGLTNFAEWFSQCSNSFDMAKSKGITFEGRKLHQKLGLSKREYRMFTENNYSIAAYDCVKEFPNNMLSAHHLNFLILVTNNKWDTVKELLRYTSLDKIILYITNKFTELEYGEQLSRWMDYLEMCSKLELVLWYPKILFPANLVEEHDRIMGLVKEREKGVFVKKIRNRYSLLKEAYGYEDNNYMIVVPCNYSEIAREAKRLNNCLIKNGYYKRHADGEITLLFLRRREKPAAAFFCFSMNKKEKITSIEGYQQFEHETKDRIRPGEKENAFLEKWQLLKCRQYVSDSTIKKAA